MRFLFVLALALSAMTVTAANVTIVWNASPTPGVTYKVYGYPLSSGTLTFSNRLSSTFTYTVGTNLTATIIGVTSAPLQLAVTASAGTMESDLSNVIVVATPLPPTNVRVGP